MCGIYNNQMLPLTCAVYIGMLLYAGALELAAPLACSFNSAKKSCICWCGAANKEFKLLTWRTIQHKNSVVCHAVCSLVCGMLYAPETHAISMSCQYACIACQLLSSLAGNIAACCFPNSVGNARHTDKFACLSQPRLVESMSGGPKNKKSVLKLSGQQASVFNQPSGCLCKCKMGLASSLVTQY